MKHVESWVRVAHIVICLLAVIIGKAIYPLIPASLQRAAGETFFAIVIILIVFAIIERVLKD